MTETTIDELISSLERHLANYPDRPVILENSSFRRLLSSCRDLKTFVEHISEEPLTTETTTASDADFRRAWDSVIEQSRTVLDKLEGEE